MYIHPKIKFSIQVLVMLLWVISLFLWTVWAVVLGPIACFIVDKLRPEKTWCSCFDPIRIKHL